MAGFKCRKATTTMKVVDMDVTRECFEAMVYRSLAEAGWLKVFSPEKADEIVKQDTDDLLNAAAEFEVGMIIEKRGPVILEREAATV
jgi:hypothetical protein